KMEKLYKNDIHHLIDWLEYLNLSSKMDEIMYNLIGCILLRDLNLEEPIELNPLPKFISDKIIHFIFGSNDINERNKKRNLLINTLYLDILKNIINAINGKLKNIFKCISTLKNFFSINFIILPDWSRNKFIKNIFDFVNFEKIKNEKQLLEENIEMEYKLE